MDFNFALDIKILVFLLAFVVFGGWQIAKLVNPKWFYPIDENQKTRVAEIFTMVNLCVAVVASVIIMAFGLTTNFWDLLTNILTIFSATSFFELFKA